MHERAIYNYIHACPNGDIFVLGFSQGAQVTTDALAGIADAAALNIHGQRNVF